MKRGIQRGICRETYAETDTERQIQNDRYRETNTKKQIQRDRYKKTDTKKQRQRHLLLERWRCVDILARSIFPLYRKREIQILRYRYR